MRNKYTPCLSAALCGIVLFWSGTGVARAQGRPPDAAGRAEAERAGKEGERLLAQHDAARAVEQLQRAFALSHNPRHLLPLGMAYAEAERPLDALDALGRYLKEGPALPDAKRKEIGGKLQVMLDQVAAVVTIEASRQNAGVKVDGRSIGNTPIEAPLRLLPGKHEIVLQPAPTDPSSGAKAIIEVRPGERKAVKLEPGPRSRFLEPQSQNDQNGQNGAGGENAGAVERVRVASSGGSEGGKEFYKRWWFWTGVGAAAVLVIGLSAGLASRSGGGSAVASADMVPSASTWNGGVIDARSSGLLGLAGAWR